MPRAQRPDPIYVQVVRHIRRQILSGELGDGDMVPSARQIQRDWQISLATATRVLGALRAEGMVRAKPGIGTVVSTEYLKATPTDRLVSVRRRGRIYAPDEFARIRSAEFAEATGEVAEALGVETGVRVIRRHRVTYQGDTPVSASVSWFHEALAETAPRLLEAERITQGTPGYIAEVTGRVAAWCSDQFTAAAATERQAEDLGIEIGRPVLCGRNWFYDAEGGSVIEYGEYVSREGRWVSYDYGIGPVSGERKHT